jgi:phosphoglycolate phosphatase
MTSDTNGIQTICFDLDGTLADSVDGIVMSLNHALVACGIDAAHVEWRRFVGPPLQRMIAAALPGVRESQLADLVATFRAHYATVGLWQTVAFPGVPEMLDSLVVGGGTLYVITNKPQPQAEAVIEHLGLSGYFRRIIGGDPTGRVAKADRAAELAKHEGLRAPTFVGDSIDDLQAADRVGAEFLLAAWGYGVAQVLEARPEVIRLGQPSELPPIVRAAHRSE